ncbi:ATP synthase subunit I [Ruthenibacterium lactatiformans]|uniref:ATP synthase subunit I n=1 Tax=Ruthenibacterium lactatiformans TaxID=1550024 RepID=UPI000859764E|nr:ATP synthase subunit I [Ruthenibacterium lactatiformans]
MKIQEATKRETLHIAAGTLAFSAVMNGVFALLGRWDLTVLWGTLLGGGFAVLNFFLLGLTVQKMAGDPNEKKASSCCSSRTACACWPRWPWWCWA